jgi:death-on-curing protein
MNTKLLLEDSPQNKFKRVDISDFENLCFGLAKEHLNFVDQPIPDFITRNPGILESCLETPFQSFGGVDPHPRFIDKLSLLFYLLIKNHPFQNGNKRIAVATLFVVLYLNGLWLTASELLPYELAKSVAASKMKDENKVILKISKFISKYCTEA